MHRLVTSSRRQPSHNILRAVQSQAVECSCHWHRSQSTAASAPQDQRSRPFPKKPPPRRMEKDAVSNMYKMSAKLVDRQTNKGLSDWNETKKHRSDEFKLKATVKHQKRSRMPSKEEVEFMADEERSVGDADDYFSTQYTPGTFIETRRNEISAHGVVLGDVYVQKRWRVIILMTTGEVWNPLKEDILFSIPSMLPAELAMRCGLADIAENSIQLNARVEALKRLRMLENSVTQTFNLLSTRTVDLHTRLSHSDPEKWNEVTVSEVANLLYDKPRIISFFAVHKYLMLSPLHFEAQVDYHITQAFRVRPRSHVEDILRVNEWCRTKDSPISSFVNKAIPIMEEAKRVAITSFHEAPSVSPASQSWNDDDRIILEFLRRALRQKRSIQGDPYAFGQGALSRRLRPKLSETTDDVNHSILVALGVLAPWQDLVPLRPELGLDISPPDKSPLAEAQTKLIKRGFSTPPTNRILGPEDFYPTDPLESIRHDFGDMPVYVIDDSTAQELDDGISVENIPAEPEYYWVHAHIADPGSILPPSHVFAQAARLQEESLYFLHRTWPLFPRSFIHDPAHGVSLGARSKLGGTDRTLTFSAKVDPQGKIVDYKIRAGLVRNVHLLSYDSVDAALSVASPIRTYPFGAPEKRVTQTAPLSPKLIADFAHIQNVAGAQVKRRYDAGIFITSTDRAHLLQLEKAPDVTFSPGEPVQFRGFPSSVYAVSSQKTSNFGSRGIVAEIMQIAGRVASLFCRDRGLPAVRRTSPAPFVESETGLENLLKLRNPHGYVDYSLALPYITQINAASYSLEPEEHFGIALSAGEGYSRSTSPLRRYNDLLLHWQIHSALLGKSKPLFDEAYLREYMASMKLITRRNQRGTNAHYMFWLLTYLKRWMQQQSVKGPDPVTNLHAVLLDVPVMNNVKRLLQAEVDIPVLGLRAHLLNLPSSSQIGDSLPVRISNIQLGITPGLVLEPR